MRACCALQSAIERAFSCSTLRRRSLWIIGETDDRWIRLTWNFSDCSVALRFVFLTQQQRLNCVDVFISMRTASDAARTHGDCSELHQQPVDAFLRPTVIQNSVITTERCKLYIHTDFWSKFCLLYWTASKLAHLLDTASKVALFSMSDLKDEKLIKSKRTWKLKHAISILETFEYFCQI